jgi:hypothetical protein
MANARTAGGARPARPTSTCCIRADEPENPSACVGPGDRRDRSAIRPIKPVQEWGVRHCIRATRSSTSRSTRSPIPGLCGLVTLDGQGRDREDPMLAMAGGVARGAGGRRPIVASWWPVPPWRWARSWAFCPATWSRRWRPGCARCWTRWSSSSTPPGRSAGTGSYGIRCLDKSAVIESPGDFVDPRAQHQQPLHRGGRGAEPQPAGGEDHHHAGGRADSKVVVTGDPYQIDNPLRGQRQQRLHLPGGPLPGSEAHQRPRIDLRKGERSQLAELGANLL